MPRESLKTVSIGIGALLVLAGLALLHFYRSRQSDVLTADASSARFDAPSKITHAAEVRPEPYRGPALTGLVRTRDGAPVAGARIMLSTAGNSVFLTLGEKSAPSPGNTTTLSSADGRFTIQPVARPLALIIQSDQGFGFAIVPPGGAPTPSPSAATSPAADSPPAIRSVDPIVIEPWGRVEATVRREDGQHIVCSGDQRYGNANFFLAVSALPGPDGRLIIEQAPVGRLALALSRGSQDTQSHWYNLQVQSGRTVSVNMGGAGRSVIGHVTPAAAGFASRQVNLATRRPALSTQESFTAQLDRQGSFRFDDVAADEYQLSIQLASIIGRRFEVVGTAQRGVAVRASSGGRDDPPVDLGAIPLKMKECYISGQPAAPLAGTDATGKSVGLANFLGRYVLLSITSGPENSSWGEIRTSRALYDRFGSDPRLTLLTAYVGDNITKARQAANNAGISGPLIDCGPTRDALPRQYQGSAHATFLIDPAGVIQASNLDPMRAYALLDQLLAAFHTDQPPGVHVQVDRLGYGTVQSDSPYGAVPAPVADDAATGATLTLVDGELPDGPDPLKCLNDGRMPTSADSREQNFRLAIGTLEGRVKFDFGKAIPLAEIHSYSWHTDTRAPQLYRLFASNGGTPDFDPSPKIGVDPASHGWTFLATVDTRPVQGPPGGRYAVSVSSTSGSLGTYQYLLFEMFPTEADDGNGNTFYSEIDAIKRN